MAYVTPRTLNTGDVVLGAQFANAVAAQFLDIRRYETQVANLSPEEWMEASELGSMDRRFINRHTGEVQVFQLDWSGVEAMRARAGGPLTEQPDYLSQRPGRGEDILPDGVRLLRRPVSGVD